ncbi:acetylglutamate kinase [Halalkalibacter urbisdiaboli]|uniref:acetylglutamate kinase n=1 Tax=Halalkalibacter urbisdiaboli TaxID=1960589 RepID=UPI001A99FE93|nr:acetylglutamate kinase [Halalkalibacter urbisdiaboli]
MSEIVVIKCGGSTIAELSDSFFQSIVDLKKSGKHPILVHGGGPDINQLLQQLNIKSVFVDGLRKTTTDVLNTVEMVLCGKVNKQLVTSIQKVGGQAIGLSGCDGKLIEVKAVDEAKLGFVGEPVKINEALLHSLISQTYIPVIAPVGVNNEGTHFNVNADSAAAWIAFALGAQELVFVTDVDGILKDGVRLDEVTTVEIENYIEDGTIYGGMIPKVKGAIKSLSGTLQSVLIMNGKGSSLSENGQLVGTKIMKAPVATKV